MSTELDKNESPHAVAAKDGEVVHEQKSSSGPMSVVFPPDQGIWNEARRLVSDKNIRVENLAICACQDPVIVIELLRISNAMFFAGGRSPITSTETSIVRLGSQVVLETLEKMKDRVQIDNDDVSHWFEVYRSRGKRTAIVAKILGEAVAKAISDECQAVGLLSCVGEMLAVAYLKEEYVKLAEEHSRSGVNYRLAQDYKFDVERMGLNYLRRQGIPEALIFALDREGRARTKDRAILKPLTMAATEMVDAFDNNRWEKIAPGKSLAPKSSIRMLQMPDTQYLKVYERASEYLFSIRIQEEKKRQAGILAQTVADEAEAESLEDSEANALQSEISSLLESGSDEYYEEEALEEVEEPHLKSVKKSTKVQAVNEYFPDLKEQFNLGTPSQTEKKVARVQVSQDVKAVVPPTLRTENGTKVLSSVSNMMSDSKSSEELLSKLLQMLVDDGPFEKSALIVVSKDRKNAIVVAARGPGIGSGQKLTLTDPLNPLVQCFSKVQSFGNKEAECSPFGSKTFALSPIDADHETPVVLYADCGNDGSLSFEARRVFRNVVEILNQKLPSIPGGIPVELST